MEDLQQQLLELRAQLEQLQAKANRADELEVALQQSQSDHQQVISERDQLRGEARAEAGRADNLAARLHEVQPLAEKAKDLERELKEATEQKKGKTVLVTRERKLQKLYGRPKTDTDPEVSDWISDMRQHIEDLDESQKIDTIMGYLGGEAKDEVKLRPTEDRNTAEKILMIIETSFKVTASLAMLSQMLFNRIQQPDETIQKYSLALLKLNSKIQKKGGASLDDVSLIDKFVEGLSDDSLKRELRRLSREDPSMQFVKFREKVLDLVQEDELNVPKRKTAKASEVQADSEMSKMMKMQKEWQERVISSLEDLKNHQHLTDERLDALMREQQERQTGQQGSRYSGKAGKWMSRPTAAATANTPSHRQGKQPLTSNHSAPDEQHSMPAQRPSSNTLPRRDAQRPKGPCFLCGRLGHIARECWGNQPVRQKKPSKQENHMPPM